MTISSFQLLLLGVGAIMCLLICVVRPSFGLVLFFTIPFAKSYLPFRGLLGYGYDIGAVLFALAGVLFASWTHKELHRIRVPGVFALCLGSLVAWTWIRYPSSSDLDYGLIKALIFTVFDTLVIALGFLVGRSDIQIRNLGKVMVAISMFALIGILFFGKGNQEWEGARITMGSANPLAPADLIAYSLLLLIPFWIAEGKIVQFVCLVVIGPLAVLAIAKTGSRFPLVGIPIVVAIYGVLYRTKIRMIHAIGAGVFGIVILLSYSLTALDESAQKRFQVRVIEDSVNTRVKLVEVTLSEWLKAPVLGVGPGGSMIAAKETADVKYPHNVLLEVGCELGVIGLSLYLILLRYGFKLGWLLRALNGQWGRMTPYYVVICGAFVYHFIASFKTGSYAGSNGLYFFWGAASGLAAALGRRRPQVKNRRRTTLSPSGDSAFALNDKSVVSFSRS